MINSVEMPLFRIILAPTLYVLLMAISPHAKAVTFEEIDRFSQSDAAANDSFGFSYAIDGDTVILGSPGDDDAGSSSGSAYIFVRNSDGLPCLETSLVDPWCQQSKLTASDAEQREWFGYGVAISGDTAVVSARRDDNAGDDGSGFRVGSVYVFERIGSIWAETAKFRADDPSDDAWFGTHLALEDDTLAVGTRKDDQLGVDAGATYIFTRSGGAWGQQAKLVASDGEAGDLFGTYVALDGNTLVVGAHTSDDAGASSGSAYVFVREGTSWSQQAKLTADDAAAGDIFGQRVEVSGNTIIVAASQFGFGSGAAYVFGRSSGIWSQEAKLTASDGFMGDGYGFNVEVTGDVAMVGADNDDDLGTLAGAVYLYVRTVAGWVEETKLTASDGVAGDWFGSGMAISGDTALIVGSPFFGNPIFGSALVFAIDFDDDGHRDSLDNCPTVFNPDQIDENDDGFGDACVDPSVDIPDTADVDPTAVIGEGTEINSGVEIDEGVVLEEDVIINAGTSIGADTTIEENTSLNKDIEVGSNVNIGPNVEIGKDVFIGDGVTIRANTIIGQKTQVCANSTIGSDVTIGKNNRVVDDPLSPTDPDDVPDGAVMDGMRRLPEPCIPPP